jgi:hypothetical protein
MEQREYSSSSILSTMLRKITRYSPTKRLLENATLYDVTYVDGEDNPLAVFSFSYRSKGKLSLSCICTRKSLLDH